MVKATDLEWGWKRPDVEAPALWGARMYVERWNDGRREYTSRRTGEQVALAILYDRKSMLGEDPERLSLAMALDRTPNGVIEQLRDMAKRGDLDEEGTFQFAHSGVEVYVRIYGGYVYVTAAWRGKVVKP